MESINTEIILPGDPIFDWTLFSCPPPGRQADQLYFVVDAETGFMRPANQKEVNEYIYSGEYDARLQNIDDNWLDLNVA